MSQTTSPRPRPVPSAVRLSNVDWATYQRVLRAFAERPGVRVTYDRGDLEIMSPLIQHESGPFIAALVAILTEELGLPLKRGGSTTLRQPRRRGVEPDACFWMANAHRMAGQTGRWNPRLHPPPDLVVEVDITRSSLNRQGIYAALRVPELWRLDGDVLTFLGLQAGTYAPLAHSLSFPVLSASDLQGFILQGRAAPDENVVTGRFREWLRQRIAPPPGP